MKLNEQLHRIKTIMGINESTHEFNEVSDDVYNTINDKYSNYRTILSKKDTIEFKSIPIEDQNHHHKPRGLWYGIGTSWIDWIRSEMPEWETDNIFKLDIDESKILMIRNIEELDAFDKKYTDNDDMWRGIDWRKVASEYGGIEIAPYIYEGRFEYLWYYGWDVASGCIWDDGVIINIEKIYD
jgi:hypothetical protein